MKKNYHPSHRYVEMTDEQVAREQAKFERAVARLQEKERAAAEARAKKQSGR